MQSTFVKLVLALILGIFLLTLSEAGHAVQKKAVVKNKPVSGVAATGAKPATNATLEKNTALNPSTKALSEDVTVFDLSEQEILSIVSKADGFGVVELPTPGTHSLTLAKSLTIDEIDEYDESPNDEEESSSDSTSDNNQAPFSQFEAIRFSGRTQNAVIPGAGISNTNFGKIKAYFYFAGGESLKGCTMADLGVVPDGVNTYLSDFEFTVDLLDYLMRECNIGTAVEADFVLSNLEKVVLEPHDNGDGFGIESLLMEALDAQGRKQFFYKNYSVYAWLNKINNASVMASGYPNQNSNCLGNAAYHGFIGNDGALGKLVFSKFDMAYKIYVMADDRVNSGTLNHLFFRSKTDCSNSASYVSMYPPRARDPEAYNDSTLRFYSHAVTPNEIKDGFTFKLGNVAGPDLLISRRYIVDVRQVWSTTGQVKKYFREYNGVCDRMDMSDCFTLEGGESKSYSWQVNGELVDL